MFIEWDSLEVRVDGTRVNELAQSFSLPPLERVTLRFFHGLLRVEGSVRKFVSVPFVVDIRELLPEGQRVRVPIAAATAFGGIPIPRFLFSLVRAKLPPGVVTFEEPATFVVSLDRFLPQFVSADIQRLRIVDGGLAVTLGRGGADLPPDFIGGPNDRDRPRN